jgi:hypothetical protein
MKTEKSFFRKGVELKEPSSGNPEEVFRYEFENDPNAFRGEEEWAPADIFLCEEAFESLGVDVNAYSDWTEELSGD